MRWPWQRGRSVNQWVLSWSGQSLAFVHARRLADGTFQVLSIGTAQQGAEGDNVFVKRMQGLGLKGAQATIMLRSEQYQLLQINTPAVPPEELRSAARYPVSYTHLDVYKRQVEGKVLNTNSEEFAPVIFTDDKFKTFDVPKFSIEKVIGVIVLTGEFVI